MKAWVFTFIAVMGVWSGNHSAEAEPEISWTGVLTSYGDSESFARRLEEYLNNAGEMDPHAMAARGILQHLKVTGLRYVSTDQFMAIVEKLLRRQEDSPLAHEHLLWLKKVLRAMEDEFPRVPSLRRVSGDLQLVLNHATAEMPMETLIGVISRYIQNHDIEREILEEEVGAPVNDPRFGVRLFSSLHSGQINDSLGRLLLGQYLHIRSIFTPTIRQSREATKRLARTGGGELELRRVTKVGQRGNFVRNGWGAEYDDLRIAMGTMQERVFPIQGDEQKLGTKHEIEREVLLLVDVTSSMNLDGRGQLRNLLVPSYLDQVFSEAKRRREHLKVHIICYGPKVGQILPVTSLKEAREAFVSMANNKLSIGGKAEHARAMTAGITQILQSDDRLTHLNIMIVSDGEEPVDLSALKAGIAKLKVGREGLRLGVAAIALVDGERNLANLTKQMAESDTRFGSALPMLQVFDSNAVAHWTGPGWLQEFTGSLNKPTWRAHGGLLSALGLSLRTLNLNEREKVSPGSALGETGDHTPGGFDDFEDGASPDRDEQRENAGHDEGLEQNENAGHDKGLEPKAKQNQYGNGADERRPESQTGKNQAGKKAEREKLSAIQEPRNVTPEEKLDATPLYRITRLRGRMPDMLYVAQRNNLPRSLIGSMSDAINNRDIFPVRLSAGSRLPSLVLEPVIPSVNDHGLAAIAKPEGFALSSLSLFATDGQRIEGYRVYEITRNGLYIVDLRGANLPAQGEFRYNAEYVRESIVRARSPLFDQLVPAAVAAVSEMLNQDLLQRNARSLSRLSARKKPVRIEDVEQALRADGTYTFNPESTEPAKTAGPFARFQKFLVGDRLTYQCNGAAPLLADILNHYAAKAGLPHFFAETVGGYKVEGEVITGGLGHMVTFAADLKIPYSYQALDATPKEMDAGAAKYFRAKSPLSRILKTLGDWGSVVAERTAERLRARYFLPLVKRECEENLKEPGSNGGADKK